MKRYFLFAGDHYYPGGGMEDFEGDFDTFGEAKAKGEKPDYDWWHVWDTHENREAMAEANNGIPV